MEFYENILCVSGEVLIVSDSNPKGLMTLYTYQNLKRYNHLRVVRRGCRNTPVLVAFDSLPAKYRAMLIEKYGDPMKKAESDAVVDRVVIDPKAQQFYADWSLADGESLKANVQRQYTHEASILNTLREVINKRITMRKADNGGVRKCEIWGRMAEVIHAPEFQERYRHSLPKTGVTLRRRMNHYNKTGYAGLVHSGYSNDNSRKVTILIERLILSLYTMENKPFAATVHDLYHLFVLGKIEVFDKKTGELFNRNDFLRNGEPILLSESTIWAYINNPKNRIVVDELRNDQSFNRRTHQPYHRRKNPNFSFSKISMDDRDLTRKMHNGKRVKAYYAYDVASGAVIGRAHSRDKNAELLMGCMRDMFRTIEAHGWGMPAEVEVEHHLVNEYFDDLAVMFPYVRICAAANSREKRAEHFNKAKKYGAEKKMGQPTGRWYSRHEAYYMPLNKVNDQIVHPTGDYDEIVADDLAAITAYNNELHPKQKTYPGMTRWQVLCEHLNPNLTQYKKPVVARYVGYTTPTSIRNSKEVTVKHAQYYLPNPKVMERLATNDLQVQAYYLPNTDGVIDEVYLYQGDKFIATCTKINPYNEAAAEQTDADRQSIADQSAYDAQYRKMVKEGKSTLAKIGIIEPKQSRAIASIEAVEAETVPMSSKKLSFDEMIRNFDPAAIKQAAQNNL